MPGFDEFATTHSSKLFRRALTLAHGDWHTAEDLLQATLLRTACHWSAISHPEAYAQRVLTNLVRDRYRSAQRTPRTLSCGLPQDLELLVAQDSVEQACLHQGDTGNGELEQAIATLTSRQRKVIVLRYWYGMTEADIAETLGIAVGAVKSLSFRAMRSLRWRLLRLAEEKPGSAPPSQPDPS
ncbi:sigma-70 family RNA polymerase sigma factor [Streptomyces sp. TRM72054]|uniref:RNA polymerase sigma factor n=1 Tax=Streptomyces sp. TRM72054 TaxID=2870562 RepID=UPI001C8BFA38|nr:sigma-70 family RNA polymerase sigma factor [Streptomyces sp. TRM72054]MBX9394380.1 sigma-70 family RNA polymerase sigma factor [Streptomyces sp. TRM72054]